MLCHINLRDNRMRLGPRALSHGKDVVFRPVSESPFFSSCTSEIPFISTIHRWDPCQVNEWNAFLQFLHHPPFGMQAQGWVALWLRKKLGYSASPKCQTQSCPLVVLESMKSPYCPGSRAHLSPPSEERTHLRIGNRSRPSFWQTPDPKEVGRVWLPVPGRAAFPSQQGRTVSGLTAGTVSCLPWLLSSLLNRGKVT